MQTLKGVNINVEAGEVMKSERFYPLIAELIQHGKSPDEIAELLCQSKSWVLNAMQKGVRKGYPEMGASGVVSPAEVARLLGINKATVYRRVHDLDIATFKSGSKYFLGNEGLAELDFLANQSCLSLDEEKAPRNEVVSISQAASIIGHYYSKISRFVRELGVPVVELGEECFLGNEGLAELDYILNEETKICDYCGTAFVPKTFRSGLCSSKCRDALRNRNSRLGIGVKKPKPKRRRVELARELNLNELRDDEEWVGLLAATRISGLSPLQIVYLSRRGAFNTRKNPQQLNRYGKPSLLYAKSEMLITREIYEKFAD